MAERPHTKRLAIRQGRARRFRYNLQCLKWAIDDLCIRIGKRRLKASIARSDRARIPGGHALRGFRPLQLERQRVTHARHAGPAPEIRSPQLARFITPEIVERDCRGVRIRLFTRDCGDCRAHLGAGLEGQARANVVHHLIDAQIALQLCKVRALVLTQRDCPPQERRVCPVQPVDLNTFDPRLNKRDAQDAVFHILRRQHRLRRQHARAGIQRLHIAQHLFEIRKHKRTAHIPILDGLQFLITQIHTIRKRDALDLKGLSPCEPGQHAPQRSGCTKGLHETHPCPPVSCKAAVTPIMEISNAIGGDVSAGR